MNQLKSVFRYFLLLNCLFSILIFSSCSSSDGEDPIPISANLGSDLNVNNGDLVTISFANSTAPEGTEFTLSYAIAALDKNGSNVPVRDEEGNEYTAGSILLSTTDKNNTFSFIPSVNGVYIFQLNVGTSQDQLTVTVSGPIVLTNANISENLTLVDQNGSDRNDLTDYIIGEVLNISQEEVLIIENNVQIEVNDGAGIVIDNGYFGTNGSNNSQINGDNWKGILVKNGGEIQLQSINIINTGSDSFDGYDPALITIDDGTVGLQSSILYSEVLGINLLNDAVINPFFIISGNSINVEDALHCNVFQSELIVGNISDISTAYVTIMGSGDTFIATGDDNYSLNVGSLNVYIKGGLSLSEFANIQLAPDRGLFFEENTGLILSQGGRLQSDGSSFIRGWEDSNWKGIIMGGTVGSWLRNVEINGAGFSEHSLSNGIKSSIYLSGRLDLCQNVNISNGGSVGMYFTNGATIPTGLSSNFSDISFSNMEDSPISGPADVVSNFLLGSNYDFGADASSAAIKIHAPINSSGEIIFNALGNDHFYQIDENLNFNSSSLLLFINEGAHLKFNNTSLYIGTGTSGQINIEGTSTNPVTLTALDEAVGWGGLYLGSSNSITYTIDHANLSFGGNTLFTGATDEANLVLNTSSTFNCTNSNFSNSKNWGVVLEANSNFFDFEAPANNNTLSNNNSGNVNDKTI